MPRRRLASTRSSCSNSCCRFSLRPHLFFSNDLSHDLHSSAQVARLEQLLRGMYQKVLAARASQWDSLRADCVARMEELAEVFGGRQQLSRVVASKKLEVGKNMQILPKMELSLYAVMLRIYKFTNPRKKVTSTHSISHLIPIGLVESSSPADGRTSVGRSISGCKDSCPAYTGQNQHVNSTGH